MRKYTLFIGNDISKKWIDVCPTLNGDKSQMPHGRFDNEPKGFRLMLKFIRQSKGFPDDASRWLFCMEHTGVYTFPLCKFLETKGVDYTLVNPLHLKYCLGLRRGKSDAADAADIARFAFLHRDELKPRVLPSDKLLIIKNLLSFRHRLVSTKKGLQVAATELRAFADPVVSRDVFNYSKRSVGHTKKTIDEVEKRILEVIRQDEELSRLYDLVTSVKGAGLIVAAGLLVYTVAFTAFRTSRQFATYIGTAPFGVSSGSSLEIPAKVSHFAHKKIKGWISNGAACATNYDKELRAYYERRIAEGKNKYAIQNAIRNKFLHRIFAVVKRGTPYVELALHRS